jgi:hypothetical protein
MWLALIEGSEAKSPSRKNVDTAFKVHVYISIFSPKNQNTLAEDIARKHSENTP